MPIRVHCPSCDDRFVTSRRYRGKRVRCPVCRDWIKIRAAKGSEAAEEEELPESPSEAAEERVEAPQVVAAAAGTEGPPPAVPVTPPPTADLSEDDSLPEGAPADLLALLGDDSSSDSTSSPSLPTDHLGGLSGSSARFTVAQSDESAEGLQGAEADKPKDLTGAKTGPPPDRPSEPSPANVEEAGEGSPSAPPESLPSPAAEVDETSDSDVLEAGFEEDPALTSDIGLLALDLEQQGGGNDDAVPLDEPLNGASNASQDVLAYLAASGGPETFRAGATYRPKDELEDFEGQEEDDSTSRSLTGEEREARTEATAAMLKSTPEPKTSPADTDSDTDEPVGRSSSASYALLAGAVLIGLSFGIGTGAVWMTMFASQPDFRAVARGKSEHERPKQAPAKIDPEAEASKDQQVDPNDPYASIEIVSATLLEQRGWFSTARKVEVEVRNSGDKTLSLVVLRARVFSALFDSSPLLETRLETPLPGGLVPGQSTKVSIVPPAEGPLSTTKLPKGTSLRVKILSAEWS